MAKKINIDSTELLVDFKTAKNKREQINILADLHCCSPRTIAELLKQLGALEGTDIKPLEFTNHYEPVAPAPARPRIGGRKISFDEDVARRLFAEGVSTRDMAKALGVSQTAIQDWAKRRGLKREPPKGGPKPKPKKEKAMEQEKKFEEIVESVDAGKRDEPCAPRAAANITMEPRPEPQREADGTMTVARFVSALVHYLSEATAEAELRVNGAPVDELGFDIRVKNEQVFVDLLTRRS